MSYVSDMKNLIQLGPNEPPEACHASAIGLAMIADAIALAGVPQQVEERLDSLEDLIRDNLEVLRKGA